MSGVIAAVLALAMSLSGTAPKDVTSAPGEYLGTFKCYAYCGCYECNGKWTGYPTALGTDYEQGRTLAVDPDVIPLGTELYLEGYGWYVAEDTGSGISGKTLDMYYESHSEALEHGIKYVEVYAG